MMTNIQMVKAFNEWMRRFLAEPAAFEREFETVHNFLAEQADGHEPTYGEVATTYLQQLSSELSPN
ncbi:hypothetical protein [Mesorhizobium captivum]|uniref:hypothetical protein n=1 Tax=Mesorhizobium captivum TaxID=3072319 RepID=UPI002A24327F|nr:hypothetical protein [Mesorhizobium sp. VK23E]MDX8513580.1 hypothetical protein [Mesorhizobium sp. VK23E]